MMDAPITVSLLGGCVLLLSFSLLNGLRLERKINEIAVLILGVNGKGDNLVDRTSEAWRRIHAFSNWLTIINLRLTQIEGKLGIPTPDMPHIDGEI